MYPGTDKAAHLWAHAFLALFPKPAALRDAGFAALCGCAGVWLLLARVWLCDDF